jgi:holin-like protein
VPNPILRGFTLLLLLQLAGEATSRGLNLPIAGPIVGFLLAIVALRWLPSIREPLKAAANAILPHLSLLFVPAGVGVVLFLRELAQDGVAIMVAILFSTWLGLAVTAWVAERLAKKDTTDNSDLR